MALNIPAFFLDLTFRVINLSYQIYNRLTHLNSTLFKAISLFIADEEYFFLDGSAFPYDYKNYMKISLRPALTYNMTKNVFYPSSKDFMFFNTKTINYKTIPILSLEIVNKDKTPLYDLTNFIEKMRYIKLSPKYHTPSIGHIISVWQLYSKIVLDENEVSVNYINTEGDFVSTNIRNLTDILIE